MHIAFWILSIVPILLIALLCWCYYDNLVLQRQKLKLNQEIEFLKRHLSKLENRQQQENAKQRTTEEKLRGYLQLLDTLINTIPSAIYYKDVDGFFRGCNNAFADHILGISRDQFIGKQPELLIERLPKDLLDTYYAYEAKVVEERRVQTFEAELLCADDVRREFLFSIAAVVDDRDEVVGTIGVLLDSSEKDNAARDRLQKEKLKGVLETAGAVCHELNQPLQTIYNYVEVMSTRTPKLDKNYDNIVKIMNQINLMSTITKNLQKITRYETTEYLEGIKIIDINKSSAP